MRTGRVQRPGAVAGRFRLVLLLGLLAQAACGAAGGARGSAEIFRDELTGMEFVRVPGGTFTRGTDSPRGMASERPAHPVTVSAFWIARSEVTVGQFRRFVEATGYLTEVEQRGGALEVDPGMQNWILRPGISWKQPGFPQDDRHPAVWVTWNDAARFAEWMARATGRAYRMPTETEWEYAARERGGDLPWAGTAQEEDLKRYAWYAANSGGATHPGAALEPNALGIFDLSGNAWEWCEDWYVDYAASATPLVNPAGAPEGRFKVLRGGSWRVDATVARTTYRNGYRPDYAHSSIGFRLVLPAPGDTAL